MRRRLTGASNPRAKDNGKFRQQRSDDLKALIRLLGRRPELVNLGSLGAAPDVCAERVDANDDRWGYEFQDLKFGIEKPRHVLPIDAAGVQVVVSAYFRGRCSSVEGTVPIDELEANFVVQGISGGRDVIFTWHIDKNIVAVGDAKSIEPHPLYHIQHGGNYLPTTAYENGGVIFMDTPRILHAPVDGILAIDFALASYLPVAWEELRSDDTYRAMVSDAHERYWKPFFGTLAGYWGAGRSDAGCYEIQPCLFPPTDPLLAPQ